MKVNRKSKIIITILSVTLLAALAIGVLSMADVTIMEKWGVIQEKQSKANSDKLYAIGKNGEVLQTEFEQAKQFYILSGVGETDAERQAKDYMLKREALYQEAIKNGYSVTDEEIWNYLDELKEFAKKADNKEDIESVISQFDNEEAYWEYQFDVYKKNLPIQKYVEDMEKEFKENQKLKKNNNNDLETEWINWFEELKNQLLKEENFEIVE